MYQDTFQSGRASLLAALKAAGSSGLDTGQVRQYAGNPQSRLAELRELHIIRREDTERPNFFRYFWERERTPEEVKLFKWEKARVQMDKARKALFKGARMKLDIGQESLPF